MSAGSPRRLLPRSGPKTRVALAVRSALAAVAVYWAANAIYTGVKAASLPFNGPVEQYLSAEGRRRTADVVDLKRLRRRLAELPTGASALELIHCCHDEVCRTFSVAEGDATGIDELVSTGRGVCFDYCGATYGLALYMIDGSGNALRRDLDLRWVRGFVSADETLETAHSWIEARGPEDRWRGYDAGADPHEGGGAEDAPAAPLERFALRGECHPLNWKQADLETGGIRTRFSWQSILLARKNLVEEAVTRFRLPRALVLPVKVVVILALAACAAAALARASEEHGR